MRRILAATLTWLLLLTAMASAREFRTGEFPERLNGNHFVVYYTTKGEDAITREKAGEYLAAAERIYKRLVTEGGMRPPRVEPVPLVVMADQPGLGGQVSARFLGFDLWLQMNPQMSDSFNPEAVMAHEFFHVLQKSYSRTDLEPAWAIEGTATVAPQYALPGYKPDQADMGYLSSFWTGSERPLKQEEYQASLFWYWLADQYGGLKFLDRLLTWAEHLGWERATQLAALQGGAPEGATFDSLWRTFILAMADGRMPKGYRSEDWWDSTLLFWQGESLKLNRGDRQRYVDPVGRIFTYWEPLSLQPYTFTTVAIDYTGPAADLVVTGDSGSVEAYLINPGPAVVAAMNDYSLQPTYGAPAPVPTDPATTGAALEFGKPVRLTGNAGGKALVLLVRLGGWGTGNYALELRPAASGTQVPAWQPLARIGRKENSAASPPPLTATELASLRAGRYLTDIAPIDSEPIRPAHVLTVKLGSEAALLDDKPVTLPLKVTAGDYGEAFFPARAVVRLLGGTVSGNRFTLGNKWVAVTPGSDLMQTADGPMQISAPVRASGTELMVPSSLFSALEVIVAGDDVEYLLVAPMEGGGKR